MFFDFGEGERSGFVALLIGGRDDEALGWHKSRDPGIDSMKDCK